MERWRWNFEQELEKAFILATLVDHGDDEEAAGPSRRGAVYVVVGL
jgi:hypothetical protein